MTYAIERTRGTIRVRGVLDADCGSRLIGAVAAASATVSIDCTEVERVDGAGLSALVVSIRSCRARGHPVVITGLSERAVARLRSRAVLDRVLPVRPRETLTHLRRHPQRPSDRVLATARGHPVGDLGHRPRGDRHDDEHEHPAGEATIQESHARHLPETVTGQSKRRRSR